MLISVNSTTQTSGWENYVENGTEDKPRDKSKIEYLEGDFKLSESLKESIERKVKAYTFVVGFKGKPDNETMMKAYKEVVDNVLIGIKKEDVCINAILHKDTDNYHIHFQVVDMNLSNGKSLDLYFDKRDRQRYNTFRDIIEIKYNIERVSDNRHQVPKDKSKLVDKWRAEHNQNEMLTKTAKQRRATILRINDIVKKNILNDNINSVDDLKSYLETRGLKFVKQGFNRDTDLDYLTFQDKYGKKLKFQGDYYGDDFFKKPKPIQKNEIETGKRSAGEQPKTDGLNLELLFLKTDLEKKLEGMNSKRLDRIEEKGINKKSDSSPKRKSDVGGGSVDLQESSNLGGIGTYADNLKKMLVSKRKASNGNNNRKIDEIIGRESKQKQHFEKRSNEFTKTVLRYNDRIGQIGRRKNSLTQREAEITRRLDAFRRRQAEIRRRRSEIREFNHRVKTIGSGNLVNFQQEERARTKPIIDEPMHLMQKMRQDSFEVYNVSDREIISNFLKINAVYCSSEKMLENLASKLLSDPKLKFSLAKNNVTFKSVDYKLDEIGIDRLKLVDNLDKKTEGVNMKAVHFKKEVTSTSRGRRGTRTTTTERDVEVEIPDVEVPDI